MKNEVIYETVQTIVESQEMKMTRLDQLEDGVATINLLREDIKTLIGIVYECGSEIKELKKVADMLQKVEKAKARFIERAIDNTLREDYKDIMSYDARNEDVRQISLVKGKLDINA